MAYVLSSVSGNLISAASAGYAPTNSGDVSAIASAYQVVSSTATQLYAGTAYVTSINDAPISAARAGNAANASMATSAYYDGTGRLISALPDSAAVSAIASSYAESAASSKQDTLTFGYNTADQISSINGSALGGMDEAAVSGIASAYAESAASSKLDTTAFNSGDFYTTANPSGFIDSAYVDSAVSGKADASALSGYYTTANESGFITGVDLTDYATTAYVDSAVSGKADSSALSSYVPYSSLEYNTASAISGINGSALAAGSTYSAGEGIDITDDVISVETPVDIVAGPGIVIDNPDGNTLRVSVAQAEEVVLFETTTPTTGTVAPITLSESIYNFEKIKIVGRLNGNDAVGAPMEWGWYTNDIPVGSRLNCFGVPLNDITNPSLGVYIRNSVEVVSNGTSLTHEHTHSWQLQGNSLMPQSTDVWGQLRYFRVVGIHRIANN